MLARLANKRELYTAWYTVGLMALLYVVSYVDRYILALLAAPVAKDLHLSDTQLGLLLGFGFAIVFCLAGLPLANWLDHKNRIHFVFAGVMIWSFSTLASAFATSFAWLLVFRGGVGMGEAVLMPATISLIGDLFKSGQRARPIAVFSALATLMGGGAFFLGAASISLAHLARSLGVEFPIWRLTFLILGSPGIVLGLVLLLSVSDPKRTENDLGYTEASTAELIAFLVRNWTFYVPFFLGLGLCAGISLGTVSWVPTLLVRAYKMDASSAGYAFGLACIPAGALGTFLWSAVATWVDRNGAGDGPIWALIGGYRHNGLWNIALGRFSQSTGHIVYIRAHHCRRCDDHCYVFHGGKCGGPRSYARQARRPEYFCHQHDWFDLRSVGRSLDCKILARR